MLKAIIMVCAFLLSANAAYIETFDGPDLTGWELAGGAAVVNGRLHIEAPGTAFYDAKWSDLHFTVWAQHTGEGALLVHYGASGVQAYSVVLERDAVAIEVYQAGRLAESADAAFEVPAGEWFQLGVSAEGQHHTVYIEGEEVLVFDSAGTVRAGSIGFGAQDGAVGAFDDLIVASAEAPVVAEPAPTEALAPPIEAAPPPETAPPAECTQEIAPGALQSAAEAAQPGDVFCLEAGDYSGEGEIRVAVSGTVDAPIVFAAQGDATIQSLVLEQGTSHLRFYGLIVTGFEIWGVTVTGGNEDIVLAGFAISGGEAGIRLTYEGMPGVNGFTITDSVILDPTFTALDCTPGPCDNLRIQRIEIGSGREGDADYGADGIAVEKGAHILVEDCYIHDIGGDGIDLNSRDSGPMPGIVVRRNRVFNAQHDGIKLWNGGTAANNVVWNSGSTALVLEPSEYLIAHNTFANLEGFGYLATLGGYDADAPSTIRLYNNIFYNDNPEMGGTLVYFAAGVELEADSNLYHNPHREEDIVCAVFLGGGENCFMRDQITKGAWFAQTGQGEHSLFFVNPLFVDAANGDFQLSAGSPAIDAGRMFGEMPAVDGAGNPRLAGEAPDLGAYERQLSSLE